MNSMKLALSLATLLFCTIPVYAVGNVYLQNNTLNTLHLRTTQRGSQLSRGQHWQELGSSTMEPMEKKRAILWYNRNQGISNGKSYMFETEISDQWGRIIVRLRQNLVGTWNFSNLRFGASNLATEGAWFRDYAIHSQVIHTQGRVHKGKRYILKFAAHYNAMTASDDIVYVLHEVNPYESLMGSSKGADATLRVLSYNIFTVASRTVSDINRRVSNLKPVLSGFDVLMFSEAFYNPARRSLMETLKDLYPYYTDIVGKYDSRPEDGGVFMMSRWPILKQQQMVFAGCYAEDCLASKGISYAKILKARQPYHLFATHLQAGQNKSQKAARHQQIVQLKRFVDLQQIPQSEAVLIGGDLNVDKISSPADYQSMLSQLNAIEPQRDPLGHSFSTDDITNNLAGQGRAYLDYVLYSREHLQPRQSNNAVLMFKSIADNLFGSWELSDHFPCYGYFNFGNRSRIE